MEFNKTILTLEINGNKFSAELNWDAGMDEILDSLAGLCICGTFMPKTIYESMVSIGENNLKAMWPDEYGETNNFEEE